MTRKILLIVFTIWISFQGISQTCIAPGQTPVSPINICGNTTFNQNTPSYCGQTSIPGSCNDNQNINPNFFRMNCFNSGTLGFIITPDDPSANYNWTLFDVTNTNPSDIFTNSALFVACNLSPETGDTGASSDGISLTECSGSSLPFSSMPMILQGRTYILMVSNKSGSIGNYQLSFTGGSAVITDPVPPQVSNVTTNCDATRLNVYLNKNIRCFSIASDGSDFSLNTGANITGATGTCNAQGIGSFITLTLDQALPNGNYILTVNDGSDGNTLVDLCGFTVNSGDAIPFTVAPPQPTLMDSVKRVTCKPGFVELVFARHLRCNSIAPDGSDFIFTGPQNVVTTVTAYCNAGLSNVIRLTFSSPLTTGGIYTVQLRTGSDGNTLIDECGSVSPPGSVSFTISPAVYAAFNYSVRTSCKSDTISFSHDGANAVNSWQWRIDNAAPVTTQNTAKIFSDTLSHSIRLIVSNGGCSDTSVQTIKLLSAVVASFKAPVGVCPGDVVTLVNKSSGNISSSQWDMGNNMTSNFHNPPSYQYPSNSTNVTYQVRLIVTNNASGCSDTARRSIVAVDECGVLIPTAFSPNNDGLNDLLGMVNAAKVDKPDFKVYNRYGELVFASTSIYSKWDGRFKGLPVDPGLFVWMFSYTNRDTGKKIFKKGTVMVVR